MTYFYLPKKSKCDIILSKEVIKMLKPNMFEAKKRENGKVKDAIFKLEDSYKSLGKGLTFCVKTYGCQMNEHDSENIKAILEQMGFTELDDYEKADLVILNTCAIRENAHNKVFGLLGRLQHMKETRPNLLVGFCGCMAQEESVVEAISTRYKWVDFVFGTHNIHELPTILARHFDSKTQEIEVYSIEGNIVEHIPAKRASKYKAWVNIMYGCDKFCTYCIVPYTRGKQRSRKKEDILEEINNLKEEGYQEVTLLGQNVNAYGKDLYESYDMASLLEDVALTKIPRIRFVTSHPWDFNDKMIEVISKYENIMPYIHLPLQSGSSKVLKLMGRRYTRETYLELFNKLKNKIPNVAITTDIIVGFPNETREDFEETLAVVNECKYDLAYTFIFSPREGTPASRMEDNISLEEKEERLQELNKLINKYALENNLKYKDKVVKVLLESESEKNAEMLAGYTETMKLVNVKASKEYLGKIVSVKIIDVKTWSLDGELVFDSI